jgi:hypothetical protein
MCIQWQTSILIVQEPGKIQVTADLVTGEDLFLVYRWPPSSCVLTWQSKERAFWSSFNKGTNPLFMRPLSSWPIYLPNASCPSTIPLGLRMSLYEFCWDNSLQNMLSRHFPRLSIIVLPSFDFPFLNVLFKCLGFYVSILSIHKTKN